MGLNPVRVTVYPDFLSSFQETLRIVPQLMNDKFCPDIWQLIIDDPTIRRNALTTP
jgi:hypothetical protein